MFALERHRLIRNYLLEHKQVDVRTLTELFAVSEVTIRRDLEKLEEDRFLVRTHGGAILVETPKETQYKPALQQSLTTLEIGQTAARLIQPSDTILLLSGIQCDAIVQAVQQITPLVVLTNDLSIAMELGKQKNKQVVLLGGELSQNETAVYGALTLDDMQRFHVNKMFVTVDGFSDRLELSVSSQEKALLIREARNNAEKLIILCSADQFGRHAFYSFGTAQSGDTVITDRTISDNMKQKLFEANLCLFTTVDIYEGPKNG
ncbi:DeoR/GlpR family DNA-binding transcription regulator [Gracilinema caldarium]|uniref:DeoR/GlpR family DNA-binding transcription regulator n=1 Tax=Gracilinema caldarium TaxID=215591 RepID=UPI0026F22BF5|nr:DeoR/GlpR family DNA-binding transcription regulator [Gracilinema caldarium]